LNHGDNTIAPGSLFNSGRHAGVSAKARTTVTSRSCRARRAVAAGRNACGNWALGADDIAGGCPVLSGRPPTPDPVNEMKRVLASVLLGAFCLSPGCSMADAPAKPEAVLVRVGPHEVGAGQLALSSVLLRDAASTMSVDTVQDYVLAHLVDTLVLADAARASGVADDVAAMAAATVGDAIAPARADESPGLRRLRLEYLKNAALGERYLASFDRTVDVSEEKLRARYTELSKSDEVHLRYIAATTEEAAVAARRRLASGETFADVARTVSLDADSAARGGDLGWLQRTLLTSEFADVVSLLKPGETSQPFRSSMSWNLLQLEDVRMMKILPYMKAHDALKRDILAEARRAKTTQLRNAATIEWFTRRPPGF
jgi:peptidyl-prolyl cis-trans isomerase C